MLLKQVPKARNYLKRASTLAWTAEDADDLEKCWLLLASTYMAVNMAILNNKNFYLFFTFKKNNLRMVNMTKL